MKRKNRTRKQGIAATLPLPLKWSGLQARMTFSYVWVTIACVLLLEILIFLIIILVVLIIIYLNSGQYISAIGQTEQKDALRIEHQLTTTRLAALKLGNSNTQNAGPIINNTINVPHVTQKMLNGQYTAFELLVTPDGNVANSSYPARYQARTPATQLVSYSTDTINAALSGVTDKGTIQATPVGYSIIAAAPIRLQHRIIGALYIEWPGYIGFTASGTLRPIAILLIASSIIALLLTTPIGVIFGLVTTRGLVRRLRNLMTATTLFADGNYEQRVSVTRKDEIGQLEQQFNRMAEQLRESIAQRQELAEQNARLGERSRISRELHDAISQDLFSLSMLAGGLQTALPQDSPLQTQVTTLGTTTTNTIREMRALLLELRPLQLEDLGLVEGLKELAISYSTRLGISVNTEIATVHLRAKAEHALLRISQEALANAVRHANATIITLSLVPCDNKVTLTINDNGSGFSLDESKIQHGLGLRLMQERVQELNGTFTLQSTLGQGTCISICLPQEHQCDSSLDC